MNPTKYRKYLLASLILIGMAFVLCCKKSTAQMKSFILLFSSIATLHAAEIKPARPNVIIFITDDESWLERSVYGWSKLPTPNFDRVAREGALFTRCYTSAPSCAPSRAALLTGKNFWELDEGAFIQAYLPARFNVLPDLMEAGGYFTGYTGKGYGPALMNGRKRNPAGKAFNTIRRQDPEEGISPIDYVANFKDFLSEKPTGKPFYFWCGTLEPHEPWGIDNDQKLLAKYGIGPDAVNVPDFLPDTEGIRLHRARYLYEICHLDRALGGLLKVLEDRNELANTLLIVTSDNGTPILRSKASGYDWGLHEPLAIMWLSRMKGDRRILDFVNFPDFAPTILDAAGLPVPKEMSGHSFLDVLLSGKSGQVDSSRTWTSGGLEWHGELDPVNKSCRMIRDDRYQYIVNYSNGPRMVLLDKERLPDSDYVRTASTADVSNLLNAYSDHPSVKSFLPLLVNPPPREELYDCEADPFELKNLADSPELADVKTRLKARLETYQRQTKDPRITGDMTLFNRTRAFVQERKRQGYKDNQEIIDDKNRTR